MLVGLHCSKFNIKNKKRDAYFSISKKYSNIGKNLSVLKFPYEIDTQDFIFFNDYLFILHHTAYKKSGILGQGNIEYFEFDHLCFHLSNNLLLQLIFYPCL